MLLAFTAISCSESDGLQNNGMSDKKICITAMLQKGWNGGEKTRGAVSESAALAQEQMVLEAEGQLDTLSIACYWNWQWRIEGGVITLPCTQTRCALNDAAEVGNFGVSAVYTKGSTISSLYHDQQVTKSGNNWFTAGNEMWPTEGSLSFYAYALYQRAALSYISTAADFAKNIVIRYVADTDIDHHPDFIVAKNEAIAYNISTASKPVELAFSHTLTALTFAVDAEMISGKVKRITIKGVNGQGDYDFAPILVRFERFLVVSSID